ncbi:unnamed protein product [Notodromas monacha]|uniref:Epidermal growth factor receptor substrate 15-like 1 n=1 Tax=Notodromas monacha TaxID=399045 RepID=A0A7R9BWQ9_9CRUS|nr:unnamed protein product [Notodromas monacha]CAG0922802.1 unnamed protein product [Notodromas monacha]
MNPASVDPRQTGKVAARDAAGFLKKSGLSDEVLGQIWDISDVGAKGYLDRQGMFMAMKLVAAAQNGSAVSPTQLGTSLPPPKLGDLPNLNNDVVSTAPAKKWTMRSDERAKYEQMFVACNPSQGKIPGSTVKPLMLKSKLPVDTLLKLWDLADIDKDGALDKDEFLIAMHLVARCVEGAVAPTTLPPELTKGKISDPFEGTGVKSGSSSTLPWVVSATEKARYDEMFKTADLDKDGFVSGAEIKDVFLKSGLANNVLAHIWSLCDMKQVGKLNAEQFALSLWLIGRKVAGQELPTTLAPEMVPPTFRPKPIPGPTNVFSNNNNMSSSSGPMSTPVSQPVHHPGPPHPPPPHMGGGLLDLVSNTQPASEPVSAVTPYTNPELEMMSKEIELLMKEKNVLEADMMQKEADFKIKSGELRTLQTELDTLTNALKQLENQKGMAQRRLDELESQKTAYESDIAEIRRKLEAERIEVEKLKAQADEQELELKQQEEELFSKKSELDKLRGEECRLEEAVSAQRARRDAHVKELANTRLELARVRHEVGCLQADEAKLTTAMAEFDDALRGGDDALLSVTDAALNDVSATMSIEELPGQQNFLNNNDRPRSDDFSPAGGGPHMFEDEDPFKNQDPFANHNGFDVAGGVLESGRPINNNVDDDEDHVFHSASDDPFRGVDPFGGDPFLSRFEAPISVTVGSAQGADFFYEGGRRTESVSPAPAVPAPAKKSSSSSGPPPRPAPPRNAPGRPPPPKASPSANQQIAFDPFSDKHSDASQDGGGWTANFADFSAFDQKNGSIRGISALSRSLLDWFWARLIELYGFRRFALSNGVVSHAGKQMNSSPSPWMPIVGGFDGGAGTTTTKASGGWTDPFLSEDDQVAWAKFDSMKLDEQRRTESQKEEAELQMAINLSLSDTKAN